MLLETVLLLSLFHHKSKPTPGPTPEQQAFSKVIAEDHKIILNAITGARAFEKDALMAQYERPELDAFEHQIFICVNDTDDHQLDKDVDILIELGDKLMAVDKALEKEEVI